MKDSKKVGWYISSHVVESVGRIAVESDLSISEIADRLLYSGLSSNTTFTPIERRYWFEINLKQTFGSLLKCESHTSTGGLKLDFMCLMGVISGYRRMEHAKYGLYLITLDEILEKAKNRAPDLYIELYNIVKKYKGVYKDIRTVEPQNRTVSNVYTNNIVSIELNGNGAEIKNGVHTYGGK